MSILDKMINRLEEVAEVKDENGETRTERRARLRKSNEVYCDKCLSTDVSANKRGWKLTTGFIGSNKVMVTCLKCGHKWKAGK